MVILHCRRRFFRLRWWPYISVSSSRSYTSSTTKSRGGSVSSSFLFETDSSDSTTLQLFSWGRGASGQLGGGIEETRLYPAPSASLLLPRTASLCSSIPGRLPPAVPDATLCEGEIGISCGLFHSALLIDGKFWIWGKGDGGRLGLGHENPQFVPVMNPNLDCVTSLALGGLHSVALNSIGQVFTWGYGGFGALGHSVYHRELYPRMVEGSWDSEICHVATSGTHTAAITKSGELYTWGREEGDGRLGLGPGRGPDQAGGLSVPSKVKELPLPVAAVSCGGFFTMALTQEGQLWSWGANSNYELGRGERTGGWKPKLVSSIEDIHITQIACGGYHSLALTGEGKVLSWGYCGHGQLGHSSLENQRTPAIVEALADMRVVYIATGGSTSAAVTDDGKLYMWGNARDSQIGVPGVAEIQRLPIEVKFPEEDDDLGSYKVLSVSIGASHALCLVSRNKY